MGSYSINWTLVEGKQSDGTARVKLVLRNKTTVKSGTRIPVAGYLPGYDKFVGEPVQRRYEGRFPTQSQTVTLNVQVRVGSLPHPGPICRNAVSGGGGC